MEQIQILNKDQVEVLRVLGLHRHIETKTVFVLKQGVRNLSPILTDKIQLAFAPKHQYALSGSKQPRDLGGKHTMMYKTAHMFNTNKFKTFRDSSYYEKILSQNTRWSRKQISNTVYRMYSSGFFVRRVIHPGDSLKKAA